MQTLKGTNLYISGALVLATLYALIASVAAPVAPLQSGLTDNFAVAELLDGPMDFIQGCSDGGGQGGTCSI